MKIICAFLLKLFGWTVKGELPAGVKKCVLIVAPHTSMWDFVIGRLAFTVYGFKGRFIIKKELFFFPLGHLLRWLGAIPVNRAKGHGSAFVDTVVKSFKHYDELVLVLTPEGTRKYVHTWKGGFYAIARKANVPLIMGSMDYAKKELKVIGEFTLTDDFESDLKHIQNFYLDVIAKYPNQFNLSPMYMGK